MVVARLTYAKLRPDADLDEARKVWDESIGPAAIAQKGCVGAFMTVNEEKTGGLAITLWETKEDGEAGVASGYYQEQVNRFGPFLAVAPTHEYQTVNSDIIFLKK